MNYCAPEHCPWLFRISESVAAKACIVNRFHTSCTYLTPILSLSFLEIPVK